MFGVNGPSATTNVTLMLNKKYSSKVAVFIMFFIFHEGFYDCKEHHPGCIISWPEA